MKLLNRLKNIINKKQGNYGYCHCCRQNVFFEIYAPWLRDHYACTSCGSLPRQRHLQYVLDKYFKGWEEKNIHESSPSNDFISRFAKQYSYSHYFYDIPCGTYHNNIRCENLEKLTFNDNEFDIFITQDVFEHINQPDLAAKEIIRVLKPGGFHIYTVPVYKNKEKSTPRIKIINGTITYTAEKVFHGNPIGDGKSLVTWDYGADFKVLMDSWGGGGTTEYNTKDRKLGLEAEFLEVFVSKKL